MSDFLVVGVDAGGTSTAVAAAHGDGDVATFRGGPANASSRGIDAASATIADAVRACVPGRAPAAIFVAAAGAGRSASAHALRDALIANFGSATQIAVEDDTRVALRAAIPEGSGVVLIAGTGSVAYAEAGDLRVRVGGAGYVLGDEGSAFAIGVAALRALARAYDGRAREDETLALAARTFGATDRASLLAAIYDAPLDVARVASLAPAIVAFAGKGNRTSTKIVQTAAQELSDLARAAIVQAGLGDASPAIAFAGGLLRENSLLTFLLETRVTSETPGSQVVRLRDEPERVALAMARALLA